MASSTVPRPILKSSSRKSSTSSTSSCDSSSSSSSSLPHCKVQFSPCLSTTYLTHGSVDYNRSPITVVPNNCALPKRGCPGRTFADPQAAALAQFRLEAEGRALPPLVSDDGSSSDSDESDSMPSTPISPVSESIPAYAIPPSLLKSNRAPRRGYSVPAPTKPCAYPSRQTSFEFDGRDDIFGGF